MVASVKVVGIPDMRAALLAIPSKLRKRALRNALAAGARVVQREARLRTPVLKTTTYAGASAIRRGVRKVGTVQKAISVRSSKVARKRGDVGVFVNVRSAKAGSRGAKNAADPFYWRFIEFGTKHRPGSGFLQAGAQQLGAALQVFIRRIGPEIEKLNRQQEPR